MTHPNNHNNFPPHTQDGQIPAPALSVVQIKFEDVNGQALNFKMKLNTPFRKAMDAYAERTGIQRNVLRFLFDRVRVLDDSTPASLEMEDGDTVEVHTKQIGGRMVLL